MTPVRFTARPQLLHALWWLGEAWLGRTVSNPRDVITFYLRRTP